MMNRKRFWAFVLFLPMTLIKELILEYQLISWTSLQEFDGEEFLKLLKQLIQLDAEWVPYSQAASLYIRPTFISTDVSVNVTLIIVTLIT